MLRYELFCVASFRHNRSCDGTCAKANSICDVVFRLAFHVNAKGICDSCKKTFVDSILSTQKKSFLCSAERGLFSHLGVFWGFLSPFSLYIVCPWRTLICANHKIQEHSGQSESKARDTAPRRWFFTSSSRNNLVSLQEIVSNWHQTWRMTSAGTENE